MIGNIHNKFVPQARDRKLLREVGTMRVIDREIAKCVGGFGSTRRVNYRLLGLTRAGLLRRFFLGTKGAGQKALYTLSTSGANLVGAPLRGLRRRQDEVVIADVFVAHQLGINEIYCDLKFQPILIPDAKFEKWVSFSEPLEPGTRLIPDGYFEVHSPPKILVAFLEVDLGTEGLSVWKKKVESYLQYAISGAYEKRFGQPQFRVLVIAKTERRMRSLQSATLALTDKIFWFSTSDSIARAGFWSPVWLRARNGACQPLL